MIINAILLSDDGQHLITTGWDGRVIMWSTDASVKVIKIF